jgi:hypothetical protein
VKPARVTPTTHVALVPALVNRVPVVHGAVAVNIEAFTEKFMAPPLAAVLSPRRERPG